MTLSESRGASLPGTSSHPSPLQKGLASPESTPTSTSTAAPHLEGRLRQRLLAGDKRRARSVIVVALVADLLFVVNDFRLFETSAPFWQLVSVRGVLALVSVGALFCLRRGSSVVAMDRALTLWALFVALTCVYVGATRPPGLLAPYLVSLALIPFFYFVLPLRWSRLWAAPLLLSLGVAATAWFHEGSARESITTGSVVVVLVAVNLMGATSAYRYQEAQRQLFQSLEQETTLRQDLESALEKIHTLKGMVPICAYCKRIRDDVGFWQQIESFLSQRTTAEFTHGVCPDCLETARAGDQPGSEDTAR